MKVKYYEDKDKEFLKLYLHTEWQKFSLIFHCLLAKDHTFFFVRKKKEAFGEKVKLTEGLKCNADNKENFQISRYSSF